VFTIPAVAVIGSQWGDEGKGKVVDIIAENADYIIRYQGGNNAGHTLVVDGKKYTFHALPSGVLRGVRNLIGSEVVLDPRQLDSELEKFNYMVNLGIDPRTAIIMPWHNELDNAREGLRQKESGSAIGTTAKGIGPCYEDDTNRTGIRFYELVGPWDKLKGRITDLYKIKKDILEKIYDYEMQQSLESVLDEYGTFKKGMRKFMGDVSEETYKALEKQKNVIFEGAQGTLLDKKFGNYPKVTSSHPMVGAIFDSLGLPPFKMRAIAIAKAYVTKVGSGPVVTCLDKGLWPVDESLSEPEARYIRERGKEVGTTTGRPRRVGWMDLVALKYTHRINGFSEIALTKLDVLAGMERVKIATHYNHFGVQTSEYKSWDLDYLYECKPEYVEFNFADTGEFAGTTSMKELPNEAVNFVEIIINHIGVPVSLISTGPGREEGIFPYDSSNRRFNDFSVDS